MESIQKLMDGQHRALIKLLEDFLKAFKENPIGSGMILEKFKINAEKHFSVEDFAIFNAHEAMNSENVKDTFQLMEDHQAILALLNKIQNELGKEIKKDVFELEAMLKNHQEFEDNEFYPNLDENLNENHRLLIISRIKQKIEV